MNQSANKAPAFTPALFLFLWAFFFGALVRLTGPALSDFPLMDGGLFYAMTQDILANHFVLPPYTSYNQASIPLAYPPLAFYIAALLVRLFDWPLIQVIHWLPPVISALSVPAFALLSWRVLGNPWQATLATCAYALLPASFDLFFLGGGLTRSFGLLFALLTLYAVYSLYTIRSRSFLWLSALFGSLLVAVHPESSFHVVFLVALMWLFFGRDWPSLLASLFVAVLILLATSPWWVTVLRYHGVAPFASVIHSGWHRALFWTPLLTFEFPGERFLDVIAVLGVIGILTRLARRQYFLVSWMITPFVVEPRNPGPFAILPLAMLAALAFDEVILPGALKILPEEGQLSNGQRNLALYTAVGRLLLAFFLIYPLVNAFYVSLQFSRYVLTVEERQALHWVQAQTPAEARFVILAFGGTFSVPVQEWFPALTGRVNIAVSQGYEWLAGRELAARWEAYRLLTDCIFETVDCAERWAEARGERFDYIYVYQGLLGGSTFRLGNEPIRSLLSSPRYALVYESDLIKIFHRLPSVP